MFGLSIWHLIILLVVVLIFGGARRLPEVGEGLGKGLRAFKKGLSGGDDEEEEKKKIAENKDGNSPDQEETKDIDENA